MRLDTANRSFFTLLGVALGPYLLLGMFACGALSRAVYDLIGDGPSSVGETPAGWVALAFLSVAAGGVVGAARCLYRQATATSRLARHVRANGIDAPSEVADAARRTGITRIDIVTGNEPYAYTFGILAPRVVVSTGLVAVTTAEELDAVLAHERYHVANLDPLKTVIARLIPAAFFFLPALGHLHHRYHAGRELAADRRAVRTTGRRPTIAALYKTATAPTPPLLQSAAAIGGNELLDVRVAQLETGHEPALTPLPRHTIVLTAAGLAGTAGGIAATIAASSGGDIRTGGAPAELLGGIACAVLWLGGGSLLYRRFAIRR